MPPTQKTTKSPETGKVLTEIHFLKTLQTVSKVRKLVQM